PVLDEDDARIHDRLLDAWHRLQELLRLLVRAEAHHALDAGAVVPAAVEDHDLARRREVGQVALDVHLALFAPGGRRGRDNAEHARAHALGDRLDRAALAGTVASLEDDADLESLVLDPFLKPDELDVQLRQLLGVGLALEFFSRRGVFCAGAAIALLLAVHRHFLVRSCSVCARTARRRYWPLVLFRREESHICGQIRPDATADAYRIFRVGGAFLDGGPEWWCNFRIYGRCGAPRLQRATPSSWR